MTAGTVAPTGPRVVVTVLEPGTSARGAAVLPSRLANCRIKAHSHRGGRMRNEDCVGAWCSDSTVLMALADGMGGHPQGDVAADMAVRHLGRRFSEEACPELVTPRAFLPTGFLEAHDELIGYGSQLGGNDQPRTTLVAALVQEDQLWWAHCGDSRLYVVRGGQLLLRTRDHSFIELNALLDADPALTPPPSRHTLFSCIGSPARPLIDSAGPLDLQPGDRMLLCSDGLWDGLDDAEITAELSARDLDDAVAWLTERALQEGGERCDNVTMLAMSWDPVVP